MAPWLLALPLLALACSLASVALQDSAAAGVNGKTRLLFPRFENAVPVLLYHRVQPGNGAYSVAPASFDGQMRRLSNLGFQAVTLRQYVRFVRGESVDLPQRPILITFDDGYVSGWENADPVLARYGWSAVMYIPAGAVGSPGHLTWDALRQMQASGRWQIEEHAGDGHRLITADDAGRRLPFYASELWSNGKQESFSRYKQRVSTDIERGAASLAQNLPGWTSHSSFAVPFNNYGQNGSNDPRIAPWLSGYLKQRFAVVFVQRDDAFATPRRRFANRIAVASVWDAGTLESHLLAGHARLGTAGRAARATHDPQNRHPAFHGATKGVARTAAANVK